MSAYRYTTPFVAPDLHYIIKHQTDWPISTRTLTNIVENQFWNETIEIRSIILEEFENE